MIDVSQIRFSNRWEYAIHIVVFKPRAGIYSPCTRAMYFIWWLSRKRFYTFGQFKIIDKNFSFSWIWIWAYIWYLGGLNEYDIYTTIVTKNEKIVWKHGQTGHSNYLCWERWLEPIPLYHASKCKQTKKKDH